MVTPAAQRKIDAATRSYLARLEALSNGLVIAKEAAKVNYDREVASILEATRTFRCERCGAKRVRYANAAAPDPPKFPEWTHATRGWSDSAKDCGGTLTENLPDGSGPVEVA